MLKRQAFTLYRLVTIPDKKNLKVCMTYASKSCESIKMCVGDWDLCTMSFIRIYFDRPFKTFVSYAGNMDILQLFLEDIWCLIFSVRSCGKHISDDTKFYIVI